MTVVESKEKETTDSGRFKKLSGSAYEMPLEKDTGARHWNFTGVVDQSLPASECHLSLEWYAIFREGLETNEKIGLLQ